MATITLLTPDSQGKCGKAGSPCFSDCRDQPLNCSCKVGDISFSVYSTDNYQLTKAQQDELSKQCPAGSTSTQQIDENGVTVDDPSRCDTPDTNDPNKLSRVVCYTCNPTPTPTPPPPYP